MLFRSTLYHLEGDKMRITDRMKSKVRRRIKIRIRLTRRFSIRIRIRVIRRRRMKLRKRVGNVAAAELR